MKTKNEQWTDIFANGAWRAQPMTVKQHAMIFPLRSKMTPEQKDRIETLTCGEAADLYVTLMRKYS